MTDSDDRKNDTRHLAMQALRRLDEQRAAEGDVSDTARLPALLPAEPDPDPTQPRLPAFLRRQAD